MEIKAMNAPLGAEVRCGDLREATDRQIAEIREAWDNRCVMHRRDPFDARARRILHRVVIKGTRPRREPGALPPHPRGHSGAVSVERPRS